MLTIIQNAGQLTRSVCARAATLAKGSKLINRAPLADVIRVALKMEQEGAIVCAGIFDEVIIVAALGAANPDLRSLPWSHLPRPIYPLDPETSWP